MEISKGNILVTGGTGYIGSHTVVELINAGFNPIIIDDLSNSNINVLDGIERITGVRVEFIHGSCADAATVERVMSEHHIDAVINFAASKAVGESIERPLLYYTNNLNILLNLLRSMPGHGVKGIVFSSSCTVYGEPDTNPVNEQSPIKEATSPYGNTKQICEEIIRDVIKSGAPVKSVILRYFNPIGAHPSAEIGELPNGVPQNLIPYLTQTAIGVRECLSVFGNDYPTPDGTCIRDFIDIVDLARAHVKALERLLAPDTPALEYFNVGTGRGFSVKELIDTFESSTGVKVPHKYAPRRPGDIIQVWADPSHANNVLGWSAQTPLAETLANAWRWQQRLRERGVM